MAANVRRAGRICTALVAQNALNTCIVATERWCSMEIGAIPHDDGGRAFAQGICALFRLNQMTSDLLWFL